MVFKDRAAFGLMGHFKSSLWDQVILQACESNHAIRHVVIAIGALRQTLDTTQRNITAMPGKLATGLQRDVWSQGTTHHKFALKQYGQALKKMSEALSTGSVDFYSALLVCMLTVCFEALHGDTQSAIAQIRNGLRLMRSYIPKGTSGISARLGGTGSLHEIIQAFDRLDNDSVVTSDFEPIDINTHPGANTPEDAMEKMPQVFSTLEEAKAYYEFLVNEFLHWIAYQYAWGSQQRETKERHAVSHKVKFQQRQTFIEAFIQWYSAFQPLFDAIKLRAPKGTAEYAAAICLDCRYKSLDAANNVNHFLGEMGYDEVTPKVQEVVDLANELIELEAANETTNAAKYTFEGAIIASAWSVSLKCRDPSVRRQAIAIMESRPRREGVFDSALQAKLARLQMEIEEAGKIGDFIPEHARIRGIKSTFSMEERKGTMKYLKRVEATGDFVYESLDFTW
jgi:hypothetical protein